MVMPNPRISAILSPAYEPCPEFAMACRKMRWQPERGHVPRGFAGATGELSEVELVLVVAEPGEPIEARDAISGDPMEFVFRDAMHSFRIGRDLFHRNVRKILNFCWPAMPFDLVMRKVWLTESVLCSATVSAGPVPRSTCRACGERYFLAQLKLFPTALVVALGTKASDRLTSLGVEGFISAWSVAPPGCNRKEAAQSWQRVAETLKQRGPARREHTTDYLGFSNQPCD
jgi:hypothetical protein